MKRGDNRHRLDGILEGEFRSLVTERKLTDKEIAAKFGICTATVRHWRQKFNLGAPYFDRNDRPSSGELRSLYLEQHLTTNQIGEKFGVLGPTISRWLRRYGIEARPTGPAIPVELPEKQLREMYVEKGLSQAEIGKILGISQVTVSNYLIRYGIEARPKGGGPKYLDKSVLEDLLIQKEMSIDAISRTLGCSPTRIRHSLTHHGMRLSKEELRRRQIARNIARTSESSSSYRTVSMPGHPLADKSGTVSEHRLIAEKAMGKPLRKEDEVHHINFRKRDNRVENLAVLPTMKDHANVHQYMARVGAYFATSGALPPEPLDFGSPVFWGGRWVTSIDLIGEARKRSCETGDSALLKQEEGVAETVN